MKTKVHRDELTRLMAALLAGIPGEYPGMIYISPILANKTPTTSVSN
jgi:hypothetical protein